MCGCVCVRERQLNKSMKYHGALLAKVSTFGVGGATRKYELSLG